MQNHPNVHAVVSYFAACTSGDLDQLRAAFTPDVVHFFLPKIHPPIRGADHLARYWSKFKRVYDPVWQIDHAVAVGDEVVSEWSCAFTPRQGGERRIFRGTEWYVFRAGAIAEVRAYYQYDDGADCELTGFPYSERPHFLMKSAARA